MPRLVGANVECRRKARWPTRTAKEIDLTRLARQNAERFWEKVQRGADGACWPWIASSKSKGYGQFYLGVAETSAGGKEYLQCLAHRFSFYLHYGHLPDDLLICHNCDTPLCCNPICLWAGTDAENNRDMRSKGRARYTLGFTKLTDDDVRFLRETFFLSDPRPSVPDIARSFGVSEGNVRLLLAGRGRRGAGGPMLGKDIRSRPKKVDPTHVPEIIRRRLSGDTYASIATDFNISQATVYGIVSGDRVYSRNAAESLIGPATNLGATP